MADRLLTTKQIQDLLHLDRVTIYKLVKNGEIPARRVGAQWRFSEEAVEAWLQQRDENRRPRSNRSEPPASLPPTALPDLISLETLQSIQDQFAQLLGVAVFTVDLNGLPFLPCSRCTHFCRLVHSTQAGMAACETSWREMAQAGHTQAVIHTCHAGVQYAGALISVAGQPLAMVTAGQFLTESPDAEAFRIRAEATGKAISVSGQALASAWPSLEVLSEERALQVTNLLATIANTLSTIGFQSYQMRQDLTQIAQLSSRITGPTL
jgi:excisionase family DNA binding protein